MNTNTSYAILLDPSGAGDAKENARLRAESCQTCGYPHAHGGVLCETCGAKSRFAHSQKIIDFNRFMYGCSNPLHVFGVGYTNPDTREGKGYLDP